ncbi:2-isopropylmalate synthase [Acididesulfobacillus acetoxydans]|uniref:2-isopropylmalate synthase n=1 Tax=Acididesulfobacillus acetoxydans TaxID=1561005 RepID=A0A8S0XXB5_9FIRM|nr:2-isopropylmalate synthase [Acididesulfobacillus acetoxydans]CAA7601617.1 2-isopropylmalate synthase [Acididesulfobacillus acetoxydans]CEJ07104.1 2-isopropylmalate synthase [Acididesulfobacillus acetoxydans]
MRRLRVFDTTLRDGEQSLGITLNVEEKLEIARQLVLLGIDIIEAGFPASSPGDFESVATIARQMKGVAICGLTRAVEQDIDLCAQALRAAEHPRIHTGIGVSPVHMAKKLMLTPEQVVERTAAAVKYAKKFVDDVEFYAEDGFRADPNFLVHVLEAAIQAGATVVNIPDTVGYANPWEYGKLISFVKENVKDIDQVTISVHCHNDLGMATANSLAGIIAGAGQVEGTINGIGERAGNTSLEEVIMAIYTRRDEYGIQSGIRPKEIAATSRLVSRITGVPVPDHKAIVGANAFMHASGIHQDGVLKDRETYEIIRPETIGVPENTISLSARSGRHALQHRLQELGYDVAGEELDSVYHSFLELADRKKEVFDQDLYALMGDAGAGPQGILLQHMSIATSGVDTATATVTLDLAGEVQTDAAVANGPVNALFSAIDRIVGVPAVLEDYTLKSVTRGSEALGDATVKLRYPDGSLVVGKGISTDILEASAKAYLNALSKRGRGGEVGK